LRPRKSETCECKGARIRFLHFTELRDLAQPLALLFFEKVSVVLVERRWRHVPVPLGALRLRLLLHGVR
jgi:hypothetical protein